VVDVVMLAVALAATPAAAGDRQRSGPAAVVGVGASTGGLGLGLLYYLRPGRWPLSLAPHAAIGVDGVHPIFSRPGYCAGLLLALGGRHRLTLALDYGVVRRTELALHGTPVAWQTIDGPQARLGYEMVNDNGFLLQVSLGAGYELRGPREPADARVDPVASLSAGWKAW
jgi:hypothetical protein